MTRKILICIITFLIIVTIPTISVKAATNLQEISELGKNMIDQGAVLFNNTGLGTNSITDEIVPISKALVTIGIGVILIVGVIMGIKWMTANPEQQAKLKEQSIGLLVAAVVIVGSYTIWALALRIVSKF